ncbi:hypothetical protein DFH09DRAFT_1441068 [Mycena vulgaris]|nr:hypothetical protein DFH09DRAFT_1441068 [Mycena vulgaris]
MGTIRAVVLTVFTLAGAVPARSFSATIPNVASGMPLAPPLARYRGGAPSAALSPCASGCMTAAAANSACVITSNQPCLCTDTTFQGSFTSCLQGECNASEMSTALTLFGVQCAAVFRSFAASPTTTSIPPPSDTFRSPAASLTVASSPTQTDVSPASSIDNSRSPTSSLAVTTGLATTTTKQSPSPSPSPSPSAITFSPATSPSTIPPYPVTILTTTAFLPPNVSPTSAVDAVPSTTADAPVTNGGCTNVRGMDIKVPLAAVLAVFTALYG